MSLLLLSSQKSAPTIVARKGVAHSNYHVVSDDDGIFHPLGLTLFWSLYGWKYERDRILAHLEWISQYRFDYLRILGEVDWTDRSIEPTLWADYAQVLREFVDCAYDRFGLRVEISIIGGRQFDKHDGHQRFVPTELAQQLTDILKGREHKVLHWEMANEWDRLDKVSMDDLIAMGEVAVGNCPNLVALSRPADSDSTTLAAIEAGTGVEPTSAQVQLGVPALLNLAAHKRITFADAASLLMLGLADAHFLRDLLGRRYRQLMTLEAILLAIRQKYGPDVDTRESVDTGGWEAMWNATAAAGATTHTPHTRRSDHDYKWSAVRQGYDFKDFPGATSNNEPQGPQSSVDDLDNPLQLACQRLLGILCGGACYVLHVGQGVTGQADPNHGRPENMWEVPNIDTIMRVVRQVDVLVPDGVENWKVVNNGRSDHPLPLDGKLGFWEGSDGRAPAVNKNYAAYQGSAFVVMLTGCRSVEEVGPVPAGTAIRRCEVVAYDPVTLAVAGAATLEAGESWTVPGRHDTMAGYLVRGTFL